MIHFAVSIQSEYILGSVAMQQLLQLLHDLHRQAAEVADKQLLQLLQLSLHRQQLQQLL